MVNKTKFRESATGCEQIETAVALDVQRGVDAQMDFLSLKKVMYLTLFFPRTSWHMKPFGVNKVPDLPK
jgi:hypothetical protein